MKSDATSALEHPPVPREKRPLNPWLLVFITFGMFLTVVIVGLLLLALLGPSQSLRDNEFLMPDGKVLRIEAVTWGTTHRFDYEYSPSGVWGFWERRRYPITHGIGMNQLMVWMTCHDARTGRPLDFDWWSESVVVDAHEDEIPDNNPQFWQMGPRGNGSSGGSRPFHADRKSYDRWLVFSSFPAFRTDKGGRFKLKLKNLAGDVATTIELKHPSPPAVQNWKAEELPATKTSGDVAVTLKSLKANFHWNTHNGVKRKWWYFSPDATVSENGQLTTDWFVSLLEASDPLGNQQNYGQSLSIHEPAWKVRLAVCRGQASKFTAAETWTLKDLSLPEKDTATPRSDSNTIDGVTVRFLSLAGSGKTSYSIASPSLPTHNFSSSSGGTAFGSNTKIESKRTGSTATSNVEANWPHLTLDLIGYTPLHRVYLLVKDDQGRNVETQANYVYSTVQSYFFKTEPDAKSLTLTVIVHKGHEFEFFIKPPELPEDKPMP